MNLVQQVFAFLLLGGGLCLTLNLLCLWLGSRVSGIGFPTRRSDWIRRSVLTVSALAVLFPPQKIDVDVPCRCFDEELPPPLPFPVICPQSGGRAGADFLEAGLFWPGFLAVFGVIAALGMILTWKFGATHSLARPVTWDADGANP